MKLTIRKPTEQYGYIEIECNVDSYDDISTVKRDIDNMLPVSECSKPSEKQLKYIRNLFDQAKKLNVKMDLYYDMFKKPIPDMSEEMASVAISYLKYAVSRTKGQ